MSVRAILTLVAALFLFGCDDSGPPVHFSLPQGFHGVFQVTVDKERGSRIVKSNGTLVITVPTNACVTVDDGNFMYRWHKETAGYPDGTLITAEAFTTNTVALRGVSSQNNTNFWIIGNDREYRIAHAMLPEKVCLGRPLGEEDLPTYGRNK
jgi:hypothetical protein